LCPSAVAPAPTAEAPAPWTEAAEDFLAGFKRCLYFRVIDVELSAKRTAAAGPAAAIVPTALAGTEVGEVWIVDLQTFLTQASGELDERVLELLLVEVASARPECNVLEVIAAGLEGTLDYLLSDAAKRSAVLVATATPEGKAHRAVGVDDGILEILNSVVAHALGESQQRLLIGHIAGGVFDILDQCLALGILESGNTVAPRAAAGSEHQSQGANHHDQLLHDVYSLSVRSGTRAIAVTPAAHAATGAAEAEAAEDLLTGFERVLHCGILEVEALAEWSAVASSTITRSEVGEVRVGEVGKIAAVWVPHACGELDQPILDLGWIEIPPTGTKSKPIEVLPARPESVSQGLTIDVPEFACATTEVERPIGGDVGILEAFDAVVANALRKGKHGFLTRMLIVPVGLHTLLFNDGCIARIVEGGHTSGLGPAAGREKDGKRRDCDQHSLQENSWFFPGR
jgi:hypothetical protein